MVRDVHDWWDAIATSMPGWLQEARTPGAAVAIVELGRPAQVRGFGVLAVAGQPPITESTVFEAASLSKPLFAYAVVKLFEQAALDPDRPLCDLVTEPLVANDERVREITARRVLSHTTGLPNWRRGEPLTFKNPPGEKWTYSGEGFEYLQRAVERLTGVPLGDYMLRHWLQPLGMRRTSYTWQSAFEENYAAGHDGEGNPLPKARPTQASSATTLHTTAADYARFVQLMVEPTGGVGLSEAWLGCMLTPQVVLQPGLAWGLGWGLNQVGDDWLFWQWGDNSGFKHIVAGSRRQGVGVIVLTNGEQGYRVWSQVLQRTLDPQNDILRALESL